MARIRTLKPEFWKSEQVVDCSRDARLLFIGMLNFADDRGVLKFRARTIKSEVFPEDEDISSGVVVDLVGELCRNGLVGIFEADGSDYIHILTFTNHQRVEKPTYRHPKPPGTAAGYREWSATDRRPQGDLFGDRSTTEGNGREGNGTGRRAADSGSSNGSETGSPPDGGMGSGDPSVEIFGPRLDWLTARSGREKKSLRSMLGRWVADHGNERVLEVLRACEEANAGDPVPWCQASFKSRANGAHRQDARGFGARGGFTGSAPTTAEMISWYRQYRRSGYWNDVRPMTVDEIPIGIRAKVDAEFDTKQGAQ